MTDRKRTYLLDSNGREILEGHIVNMRTKKDCTYVGIPDLHKEDGLRVIYIVDECRFGLKNKDGYVRSFLPSYEYEIIDNEQLRFDI